MLSISIVLYDYSKNFQNYNAEMHKNLCFCLYLMHKSKIFSNSLFSDIRYARDQLSNTNPFSTRIRLYKNKSRAGYSSAHLDRCARTAFCSSFAAKSLNQQSPLHSNGCLHTVRAATFLKGLFREPPSFSVCVPTSASPRISQLSRF